MGLHTTNRFVRGAFITLKDPNAESTTPPNEETWIRRSAIIKVRRGLIDVGRTQMMGVSIRIADGTEHSVVFSGMDDETRGRLISELVDACLSEKS